MPIEIRELIIKTEIFSGTKHSPSSIKEEDIVFFKKQLLEECKRMISEKTKKHNYKR